MLDMSVCSNTKLEAEKEALEKKMAEQRTLLLNVSRVCQIYSCSPRWGNVRSLVNAQHELDRRIQAFAELDKLLAAHSAEELTSIILISTTNNSPLDTNESTCN